MYGDPELNGANRVAATVSSTEHSATVAAMDPYPTTANAPARSFVVMVQQ